MEMGSSQTDSCNNEINTSTLRVIAVDPNQGKTKLLEGGIELASMSGEELVESNVDKTDENENSQISNGKVQSSGDNDYTLNDAIDHIGFGMFQLKVTIIVGLCWTADAMEMMVLSILSPILLCEWDLTSTEEALVTVVVFLGLGIGSYFWGYFSDRFGRKKGINLSVALVFVFGIASSQAPSYPWMLVLRFLVGFGVGGVPQAVTIVTEILPSKVRGKAILILELFWAVGSVFAAALAIASMSALGWRWYLILITIPIAIFLLVGLWLPESPHYLVTTNRYEECVEILKRIANHNGKTLPEGKLVAVETNEKRGSMLEMFNKHWWKTTSLLLVIWFTSAFTYYGIVLLTTEVFQSDIDGCNPSAAHANTSRHECKHLTNKDYTDFMVTSIAEFPGILFAILLLDWIGRRKTLAGLFLFAAASFLLLNICTPRTATVIFMFAVRGFVTGTFQTAYVYTPEVLPTSIRAVGLGACSMFARVGAMITPFVAQVMIHESFYLVIGVYAFFLVICAVASCLLPIETKGKDLQSSTATSLVERKGYQAFS